MINKTLSPELNCDGCLYEDLFPTDSPCNNCARNNLSGYYEDRYVDVNSIIGMTFNVIDDRNGEKVGKVDFVNKD
jgi:hypothetical protein